VHRPVDADHGLHEEREQRRDDERGRKPEREGAKKTPLRVTGRQVETLERHIDRFNEGLSPLTSFVLPGGSPTRQVPVKIGLPSSISQVAWLLGYREISAFTHAFRRWTGITPSQLRAHGNLMPVEGIGKSRRRSSGR